MSLLDLLVGDQVYIMQQRSGAELQEFDWSYRGEVRDVAVSPDGKYVAVGGLDKQGRGLVLVYYTTSEGIVLSISREREVRAVQLACLEDKVR